MPIGPEFNPAISVRALNRPEVCIILLQYCKEFHLLVLVPDFLQDDETIILHRMPINILKFGYHQLMLLIVLRFKFYFVHDCIDYINPIHGALFFRSSRRQV